MKHWDGGRKEASRGEKRPRISTENDATTEDTDDSTDITGMDDSTSMDDH